MADLHSVRLMGVIAPKRCIGLHCRIAAGVGVVPLAIMARVSAGLATGNKLVSMLWVVACLALIVVGELLSAPLDFPSRQLAAR